MIVMDYIICILFLCVGSW